MQNSHLAQSIHHVSVLVKDTKRALEFYQQILSLEVDTSRPDLGYPGAWLQLGSNQIHLLELPNPAEGLDRPAHGGRDQHLALLVSDIDELAQRLNENGIEFTRSKSGRQALFCRDPDDNALEFIQG